MEQKVRAKRVSDETQAYSVSLPIIIHLQLKHQLHNAYMSLHGPGRSQYVHENLLLLGGVPWGSGTHKMKPGMYYSFHARDLNKSYIQ